MSAYLAFVIALHSLTYSYLDIQPDHIRLENKYVACHISRIGGDFTLTIKKEDKPVQSFSLDIAANFKCDITEMRDLSIRNSYPEYGELSFRIDGADESAAYKFRIDSVSLYCEISITTEREAMQEAGISFSISPIRYFDRVFLPNSHLATSIKNLAKKVFLYRRDFNIPIIDLYNTSEDYGLGIFAPFEIPKPELTFSVDGKEVIVSYNLLRLTKKSEISAAIHIVPHEGNWRSCMKFLLNKYPEYFYPAVANSQIGKGWYHLVFPRDNTIKVEDAAKRGVKWIELHGHFPFYGLYAPKVQSWGLIFDSDVTGLSEWETGGGIVRNSYKKMNELIKLWHKYGIQTYLYFQPFEAWHQYAEKYFRDDIAKDMNGNNYPAWNYCNLMNPDPAGNWGRYIIEQTQGLLRRYPDIDGIFYDRMDYWNYDFAHDDGITMIDDRPAYMLGFALEKMNSVIFDLFHKNDKGIWGNGPPSIEVCKNLDGIMAEGSLRNLCKIQYLSLVRPMIYFPYDREPKATEEKLKNALVCGAFPSITHGGPDCQRLDAKYQSLFSLIKNREWVLTKSPVEISEGYKHNIFRTPEGDYVIVVISQEKSQLVPHPFEYNIPITINLPNANDIKYAYLLSGDWQGIISIDFDRRNNSIKITLPFHLSSSLLYLTKEKKFVISRLSSPVLIKGRREELIFKIDDNSIKSSTLEIIAPWFREKKESNLNILKYQTEIPANMEGEIEFTFIHNGEKHEMTFWITDPVSIAPKEDIFIMYPNEQVDFILTNNLLETVSVNLFANFPYASGKIESPGKILLQPLASRIVKFFITARNEDKMNLVLEYNGLKTIKEFHLNTPLIRSKDDIFFDDFSKGIKTWILKSGSWKLLDNAVQGAGISHFAMIKNDWQDCVYEVKTRCRGSVDPSINWLKTYIFFRVTDDKNFYRFGIHGDVGVIDLYKCINGEWIELSSSPFVPERGKWYALRIQAEGARIIGYINGKKVIETNDDTFLTGGIGIGVLEDDMVCEYTDIIVKRL